MFFCQFYEKWVSVREWNKKLLLESVTYIDITETETYTIKTVVPCRKYHLHNSNMSLQN